MVGGVAHTSADGAEGDEGGVWLIGVSPGGVPGGCRKGRGGGGSRDVEVRAWFLKFREGSDGVKEEGTVGDMPAGWVVEAVG